MSQPCAFVDPSSLSLPSSSLKRHPSPACSADDSSPSPSDEPPRKRPRSAITPEERKEARAHRNRIAAQNSRDRRKAQFTYLERRVAELEEENRRLRAGILTPSSSVSIISEADTNTEREQELQCKREDEQRERENQELRERIRMLERGYEAVVRALAAQGNLSVASSVPTPPASSPAPPCPSHSSQSTPNLQSAESLSPSSVNPSALSSAPPMALSPTTSNSTLVDSPLLFPSGDSFELPSSAALPAVDTSLALPQDQQLPHLPPSTGGEHCQPYDSVPAAGGRRTVGDGTEEHSKVSGSDTTKPEDEAASDADITRLFAEILASPSLGSSALPNSSTSSEDVFSKEALTMSETNDGLCLGLGSSGIDTVDWADQVRAEVEMEKLLEMLPNVQDVAVDAILNPSADLDVDMDFSGPLMWDGVSVF